LEQPEFARVQGGQRAEGGAEVAVARASAAQTLPVGLPDGLAPAAPILGVEQAHLGMALALGAAAARFAAPAADLRHGADHKLLVPQHLGQEDGLALFETLQLGDEVGAGGRRQGASLPWVTSLFLDITCKTQDTRR
jgi:hypothetical protein